jgi:hypothetical protein
MELFLGRGTEWCIATERNLTMIPQRISHWAILALLASPGWAGLDGQQICSIGQTSCRVVENGPGCGGCPTPCPNPDNSVHCSVFRTSIGESRTGVGYVHAEGGQCAASCSAHASGQGKDIHPWPGPCDDLCTYACLFTSQGIHAQSYQIQVCQRSCVVAGGIASVHMSNSMNVMYSQTMGCR